MRSVSKSQTSKLSFKNFLQTLNKTNPKHERQKKEEKTHKKRTLVKDHRCVCVCACESRPRLAQKKSESTRERRRQKQHTTFVGSVVVAFDDETRRRRSSFFFAEERRHHHERGDIVVESVCQSRPVAKTPSAHADVQTHVPGVLFRRGHVRNLLRLREGEREEEDRALIIY